MQMTQNTILITGGTSGIGLELARAFHALGNQVIIAGRRQVLLDEISAAHPGMTGYRLDMTDASALADFAAEITSRHPALSVLINNAGIMLAENLMTQDLATSDSTIATNLTGPIHLTAALLPLLLSQPRAAVLNVTSGLAFVPLMHTPTYNATKAALHSYTQSLRAQLRDTAVQVIELAPPGVQSDLMPGHASDPHMMPMADFIAETLAKLHAMPDAAEICVDRVLFLRNAETEGRYAQTFAMLNGL